MKILKLYTSINILFILLSPSYGQTIALKAGYLVDPENEKVLENQTIIIRDGKIDQIGPNITLEAGTEVIDLSNSWVMPGLMDCHVHITKDHVYRNPNSNRLFIEESTALRSLRGVYNAKILLEAGFTTIKEIGNDADYATAEIIKAIDYGWIEGPTIIYAGKIIAPYAGQSYNVSLKNEYFWNFEYLDADNPDEIVKMVRKNIYYGATTIKMVADQHPYYYNQEDIEAAVKEARKAGMNVTVHTMGGQAAKNVILGGAAGIEHGFFLSDEELNLMKEKGTYLIGTDFSFHNFYAYGMDSTASTNYANIVADRLKRAYEIGVKMAFGTDIIIDVEGMDRVDSNLEVLKSWTQAGIPPMYILKCMTFNAADLMEIDDQRGTLEVGKYGDIIALSKNPVENIENVRSIHFVMKEGIVIRNSNPEE